MTTAPRDRLVSDAEPGAPAATPSPRRRLGAYILLLLAATAGLLAWRQLSRWERLQEELVARVGDLLPSGADGAALARASRVARRELDPANARIEMARALLDHELLAAEPEGATSLERLAVARALAGEALALQPANHEAAMIVGATLALERSRTRDPRLVTLYREWEAPLEAAIALAPGAAGPRRLLAAAYLDVWPALSPAKRRIATGLVREALRDRATFERLFDVWVDIAGSLDRAAELLPDEPWSWKRLAESARAQESWEEYRALADRHRAALARELEAGLDGAAGAIARGETPSAALFGDLLAGAPVDAEFARFVDRALALRPAGPASLHESRAARVWFQWAAPLCLVRECPLSGTALQRLASLAGGLLAPEQAAFAALAAGDVGSANLLERRSETLWSEPWAPYLTLKGIRLDREGDLAGAKEALALAHRAFRPRAAWRGAAESLAMPNAFLPGVPPLARDLWQASDWWFERGASRLDLVPSRAAEALRLEPEGTRTKSVLLEVLWDGRRRPPLEIPPTPAGSTGSTVRLELNPEGVTPEPHLLEIRVLAGDLRPAMRVRLD